MLHVMESLESVGVTRRRITREEYLRMAEVGILRDDGYGFRLEYVADCLLLWEYEASFGRCRINRNDKNDHIGRGKKISDNKVIGLVIGKGQDQRMF